MQARRARRPDAVPLSGYRSHCESTGLRSPQVRCEQTVAVTHPEDQANVNHAVAAATRPHDPAPYAVEYR